MAAHAGSWRVRQIRVLIALLVAALGLAGCTRGGDHDSVQASVSVSPQAALVDQPVTVSVRGLPAGARTTVTAKATDADGTTWSATAQFQATPAGEVSLSQPSLGGSYTGANPMGLFTLMAPPQGSAPAAFLHPEAGYDVTLQASVSGRVATTATVRRQGPVAVGVVEKELRPASGGIYANLYLPNDIPLEYFTRALRVLRAQPGVDPRHVLVSGVSRGSEAALLLGAYFPQLVNGVIAGVPSSVVNPGWPDTSHPAWTLGGRPSQPSARPSSVNPTRPGSRRRSSQSSASGADPAHLRRAGPGLAVLSLQRRHHHTP